MLEPSEAEPFDVIAFNRAAWNHQVALGNRWTKPVDRATIAAAREGRWSVLLTPSSASSLVPRALRCRRPVPRVRWRAAGAGTRCLRRPGDRG